MSDAIFDVGTRGPLYVYVGSERGVILIYKLDRTNGVLTAQGSIGAGNKPSYLATDRTKRFLYAVNESDGSVVSFAIDRATGLLTAINRQSSQGSAPTHLSVDHTGRWVFAAHYSSGGLVVLPIGADGGLGPVKETHEPGTHAHQAQIDPTNRYLFVPALGSDRVAQYVFNADQGSLAANPVPFLATAAGAGPRHLAFHPNGRFAYLINELANTIQALGFDSETGRLTALQTLSTLPSGFAGPNTTAAVFVHPNGNFVFGSNRGDNSIVTFSVNPSTGLMVLVGHVKTGGATPRSFALDGAGTVLLAANLDSNSVVSFRIDPRTGAITPFGQTKSANAPSFVGVVEP